MASNLVPACLDGIGAEARHLKIVPLDEAGCPPAWKELCELVGGDMQAYLYLIELGIACRSKQPRTRGYPPRVFISYHRASPEHIAWCVELADSLEQAGYSPLLDESAGVALSPEELGWFVSSMFDADICVIVLTEGYIGGGEGMRSWLFEEMERVVTLDGLGLTEVVVVLREGNLGDFWMGPTIPLTWGLLDLRGVPAGQDAIAGYFGPPLDPRLGTDEEQRIALEVSPLVDALSAPHPDQTRLAEAEALLAQEGSWQGTEEVACLEVLCALVSGEHGRATADARKLLAGTVTIPTAAFVLTQLYMHDLEVDFLDELLELAEVPSHWQASLRSMASLALQKSGSLLAGLNQLSWCVAVEVDGRVKQTRSRNWALAGASADEAASLWAQTNAPALAAHYRALAEEIGDGRSVDEARVRQLWDALLMAKQDILPTCRRCGAMFDEASVCVRCGTGVPGEGTHCEVCHFPAVSLADAGYCPVCRVRAGGSGHVLFHQREPGGRWSVMAPRTYQQRIDRGVGLQSVGWPGLGGGVGPGNR